MLKRRTTNSNAPTLRPIDVGVGLAVLFECVRDAAVVADMETESIVLWNPAAERMFGFSVEEAIGQKVELIVAAGLKKAHRKGMARVRATGHGPRIDSSEPFETTAVRSNGEEFPVELSLSPLELLKPSQSFVLAIIRDVTERKRAERQLVESQRLCRAVFDQTYEFIGRMSPEGILLEANETALNFSGLQRSEVIGKPFWEAGWWNHSAPLQERLKAAIKAAAQGKFVRMEVTHPGPDGELHPVDFSVKPVKDADGHVAYLIPEGRDITERKRMEAELAQRSRELEKANAELEQLDKMKDKFLSMVSHELRTPINIIIGFGANLEDGLLGPLTPEQREGVGRMSGAAQNLLNLVNDLLDISKLQAGKFQLDRRVISFQEMAAEVIANLQPIAEQKQLQLRDEIPPGLPDIYADEQRISQVLMNLASNAIKFTPSGGRIVVRAFAEGEYLCCEVEDTGMGIACEDLPKLFKPFSQLESEGGRMGGTGLGLSISKGLVEASGGRLGVRSERGKGSTFWFCLPVTPKVQETAESPVGAGR